MKIIAKVFKEEKQTIIKILFLTAFLTLVTLISSFYFKVGINFINDNENRNVLLKMFLFFLSLYVLKYFFIVLRNHFKNYLNKNLDGNLYYNFLNHLFLLPNYFMKDRTTGEIMIRVKELENVKAIFSEILVTIGFDSILSLSIGIILWHIHQKLFLILCFFILLYMLFGIISGKIMYKKALNVNETEINFQSTLIENIDSIISLKNLNILKVFFQKVEMRLINYLDHVYDLNKTTTSISTIASILEEFLDFTIISIGLYEIIKNRCSLINLITFESLVHFFFTPFKTLIQLIPSYNYVKVNIQKINDFYAIGEEQSTAGLQEFKSGDILIENLNFSYNDFSQLFSNFSLKIKENTFVLFKGTSGCGKSTLCQIIGRLIDTKRNNIKVGEVSIYDYSLETIRKNITYVGQKENLMQDTIRNNILLNRIINESKYQDILKICEIESIVSKKPLRYETFLTKDSINISGGEKQRIILARALLNDFKILILDEALSEVNSELELNIIQKLKEYFKDKTIIYVSHKEHDQYFDNVYDFGELVCKNT